MSNSRVLYPDIKQVNDERWVPPLPDASKPVDPNAPKCHGCGHYHGSVNVELNCMRNALAVAREAAKLPEEIRKAGELLLRIRSETAEMQTKQSPGISLTHGPRIARTPNSYSQG